MYSIYIGEYLLPVTPSKITLKHGGGNKTVTLINGGDINQLKQYKLWEVSFSAILPTSPKSPYIKLARYNGGFKSALVYLDYFANLMNGDDPKKRIVQLIIFRQNQAGENLYYTTLKATLENFTTHDDVKYGTDISVDLTLKQWRENGIKELKPVSSGSAAKTEVQTKRPDETAPNEKTYVVKTGDCLWSIAQKQLGNGNRYKEIYNMNKQIIDKTNYGTGNPMYTIYSNQKFVLPR